MNNKNKQITIMTSITLSVVLLSAVFAFSMSTPAYAGHVEPLVALWHLDGNTADATGHVADGSLSGDASYVGGASAVFNRALTFDGLGDFMDVDDLVDKVDLATRGTVELWVKFPSGITGDEANIFTVSKGDLTNYFQINVAAVDKIRFCLSETGSSACETELVTKDTFDGAFHHVAVTSDGSDTKLYVDGEEKTGGDLSVSTDPDGQWFDDIDDEAKARIGGIFFGGSDRTFDGQIDEVRVWNVALTDQEIAESYNLGEARNAGYETSLKHKGFDSVIVWTSAFHDGEGETVPFRMMRVGTDAEIDNSAGSSIDCEKKNLKKDDCPGVEPDGTDDGILFRGLSPKGTLLDEFNPDETKILACGEPACGGDLVEVDIGVGTFTKDPTSRKPATAHFQVALDIDVALGSNVHEH